MFFPHCTGQSWLLFGTHIMEAHLLQSSTYSHVWDMVTSYPQISSLLICTDVDWWDLCWIGRSVAALVLLFQPHLPTRPFPSAAPPYILALILCIVRLLTLVCSATSMLQYLIDFIIALIRVSNRGVISRRLPMKSTWYFFFALFGQVTTLRKIL